MDDTALRDRAKESQSTTGVYHDTLLMDYINEMKSYLRAAGVNEDVVNSPDAVVTIFQGVADLWNDGTGDGNLSDYFLKRVAQPAVRSVDHAHKTKETLMTPTELSQLRYLNKEIAQDERRLVELERAAVSATKITGLPDIGNMENRTALDDIKTAIETKKQLCVAEYRRLMQYITNVDDSFVRQILTLRYIDGFSWLQVAMRIGGGNTEDSVKQAHSRFLRKN